MTSNPIWHVKSNKVNCNLVGFTSGRKKKHKACLVGLNRLHPSASNYSLWTEHPWWSLSLSLCLSLCLSLWLSACLLSVFFVLSFSSKGCAGCWKNLNDLLWEREKKIKTGNNYLGTSVCLRFWSERTSLADKINMAAKLSAKSPTLISAVQ